MPIYIHECHECLHSVEAFYSMSDTDLSLQDLQAKLKEQDITCEHGVMPRVIQASTLIGFHNGMSGPEAKKAILKDKQAERKERSRKHFIEEGLPTVNKKDAAHFKKKHGIKD